MMRSLSTLSLAALLLSVGGFCSAADLSIAPSDSGAVIKIGDQVFAEYVTGGGGSNMPYLWPIYGPGQKSMTRAYPMRTVEGEQHDHPHHRGLCFGHEDIAGTDTWAEEATFAEQMKGKNADKAKERLAHLGEIKHRAFEKMESDGKTATLIALSDYLDHAGKKQLEERRTMIFSLDGDARIIDVDIELIASEGPVVSADKKDAGLSIRVPTSMAVDTGLGGRLINSEGQTDKDAWAKRAKWCDYSGPVDGETVGVAMLNHPASFRYPTYWHARTYGLFTANPFGLHSLNDNEPDGAVTIEPAQPLRLFHRFYFHRGTEKDADIEAAWKAYSVIEKP
ncbi:MAG: PmoA family protein [Verrucomicrobiales bacterium]|nr:PmoA family protein [Verrucomicrobiales bacterium]